MGFDGEEYDGSNRIEEGTAELLADIPLTGGGQAGAHDIDEVDMDLLEVEVPEVSALVDPARRFVEVATVTSPAAAEPTAGPHRYTISVPHNDATVFSLGQASGTHNTDTGILARTNSLIALETIDEPNQTVVTLGGAMATASLSGHDDAVFGGSHGYSMVTNYNAWNQSKKQFYVISTEGEIAVRTLAKDVVIQADEKSIHLAAKKYVNSVAKKLQLIADASFSLAQSGYDEDFGYEWPGLMAKSGALYTEIVALLSAGIDVIIETVGAIKPNRASTTSHTPEAAPPGVKRMALAHQGFAAARIAGTAAQLGLSSNIPVLKGMSDGDIHMKAASSFVGYGGGTSTLLSTAFSTVVAPVATLEGLLFTGVAGKKTAVMGLLGAEVTSPFGNLFLEGHKSVDIFSHGDIKVQGEHGDLILRGHHLAGLHSGDHVRIAAGNDAGMGIHLSPDEARFGKVASGGDNLSSVNPDHSLGMKIGNNKVEIKNQDTLFTVHSGMITMSGGRSNTGLAVTSDEIIASGVSEIRFL
ncbi:MAG: hypothetical protein AAGA56_19735 [Myxococcota bacterium]